MEERYEIREQIGKGGLGAVYKAFDSRMNREVAIKRIPLDSTAPDMKEEAARQLIKDAGALASLQHPNIVTIYDVGIDGDVPYVVMELLSGRSLDELIEGAPLTWSDFKELVLQTQEALIATHELNLTHSDIKPSNLLMTWLPSGKFQIKIVDFGLTTLTQGHSQGANHEIELVFGSMFFMPPEQFEGKQLDARSDLYSMGCVYYQALTGICPFVGANAQEVIEAHLHHKLIPLQDVRADIPLWACDWVMWQINLQPEDRPESARESLSLFLQNNQFPNPELSLGDTSSQSSANAPRLLVPVSDTVEVANTTSAPASSQAPINKPSAPALTIEKQPTATSVSATPAPKAPAPAVKEVVKTATAAQALTPPEGSKTSVYASAQVPKPAQALASPSGQLTASTTAKAQPPQKPLTVQPLEKPKISNSSKTAIAAILGVIIALFGWYLFDQNSKNRQTKIYNEMISYAAKGDAAELPVDAKKLDQLLNAATNTGVVEARQTVYKALFLAKATDNTDIDQRIAEFATTTDMLPDVREVLIRDVLRKRNNPDVVPYLINYAATHKNDPRFALAALQAIRPMVGNDQLDSLFDLILTTEHDEIRKVVEEILADLIKKAPNTSAIASRLVTLYKESTNDDVRYSMLRLMGRRGGDEAVALVKSSLDSAETKNQIAAIIALGSWNDVSVFPLLTEFIAKTDQVDLRSRAFDAALRLLSSPAATSDANAYQKNWIQLSKAAKTSEEQIKIIRGLANNQEEWAEKLIEPYQDSEDDKTADLAIRMMARIKEVRKIKTNTGTNPKTAQ